MATAFTVSSLTAGYGGQPIVHDVDLEAHAGEVVAVLGPNGAGKSTLLKAVLNLIPKSAGTVHLGGVDLTDEPPEELARLGLGYVPQVRNVFPELTVRENLAIGGYLLPRVDARTADMVKLFPDLGPALSRKARTLSGGQRNMLALARALMVQPQVLILDEPTAGLAPIYVDAVWRHVAMIRGLGIAVVVVEQNAARALLECDVAYVLVNGANRVHGPREEVSRYELAELFMR